jgi:deazaflavin-dependent oxidoreductase (nitroreductase family)
MGWISRSLAWRLDPILMRLSGGRLRFGLLLPTALAETRGARTGALRRNGVIYFHDGDRVVIVASKLGLPQPPAWFHNLRSNPLVRLGGRPFRAEVITDDAERARALGPRGSRLSAVCHLPRSCRRRWSGYPDRLPPPE